MGTEIIIETLKTYGAWGLLLVVLVYVVVKGEFTFRYPRPEKKQRD